MSRTLGERPAGQRPAGRRLLGRRPLGRPLFGRPLFSRLFGRRLPLAAGVAVSLLVLLLIAMATADLWRPLDMYRVDHTAILAGPSAAYPMGTDNLGRDVLALSLHGLRTSFAISFAAAAMAAGIGAVVGLLAGAFGGWIDAALMRLVDTFAAQSHFLFGLLILVLARPLVGPAWAIMLAVGLTHWVTTARIVRSELLSLRTRPFVAAAVNMGASRGQLARWHYVPNVLPPLALAFVLNVPHAIFHETGYSFLGLGMPLETPSLGRVLALGQENVLAGGWWVSVFPGLLVFVLAAAIGTLGEWWRDRHDPRMRSELRL